MENALSLIKKISKKHAWYKPIELRKGSRYLFENYLEVGIIIEYKPNAAGVFIFNFDSFKFFDINLFLNYFKRQLKHPNANFIVTSKYIYINPKKNVTDEDLIEVFTYVLDETTLALGKIRAAISNPNN